MASVYYVDCDGGLDSLNGKREPTTSHYHSDDVGGTTDETHTFCESLVSAVDDYYLGAFLYNRTRSIGVYVTDYVGASKQLVHPTLAGNDATDEFYLVNAWLTVNKAGTTMDDGDITYVRAGTTDTLAAVANFTNDCSIAAPGWVIGTGTSSATIETTDETATEIWHDASTARPIIDGNTSYYITIGDDQYYRLKNLEIKNTSSATYACLHISGAFGTEIWNCKVHGQVNTATGYNVYLRYGAEAYFNGCTFENSGWANVGSTYSRARFDNCTFDGGALGTNYHIYQSGSKISCYDCTFSPVTSSTTSDCITIYSVDELYLNNCLLSGATKFTWDTATFAAGGAVIREENSQQVYGAVLVSTFYGSVERKTDVLHSGGASSSALMIPKSTVGIEPANSTKKCICVNGDVYMPDFRVWCEAEETTITVYVRCYGTWTARPTATECCLEAEYISNDSPVTRTKVVSTQSLLTDTDDTTWLGFTVTMTPHIASWVYLNVFLKKYQSASQGIYVDILPVVS